MNALYLSALLAATAASAAQPARAAESCAELIVPGLGYARHWVCRGNEAYGGGDLHGALRYYGRAARLAPDSADAQCGMGLVYLDLDAPRRALKRYSRALKLDPAHESALFGRAEAKDRLGFPRASLDDLDRAAALRPDYAEAQHRRAGLLAQLGRAEEALEARARAARLDASYRSRYEEELLALRGRPAWWAGLAASLLAAFGCWALARLAGRRLTGEPEADRRRLASARGAAAVLVGLWALSLLLCDASSPVRHGLGLKPAGPLAFLGMLALGSIFLYWAQERCFAPLQDRLRGFGDSRRLLGARTARYARLFAAQVLLSGGLAAAASVLFLLPESVREAVPASCFMGAAAALGILGNALFLPTALLWAYRAGKVGHGPLWDAAQIAFRGVSPGPALWRFPEPPEGMLLLLALPRRRVLVSSNCESLLSPAELEAAFAHEAAHIRERHILKNLAAALAAATAIFGLAAPLISEGESLLALPLWGLLPVTLMAAVTWQQRRNESAADRAAVAAGANPEALISALEKLHGHNTVCRRWTRLGRFFATHPSLERRALDIRVWAAERARKGACAAGVAGAY